MKFNPYLEVILAAVIWGTHGVFVKSLDLPPTTISFFRLAIPTIILLVYFKAKKIDFLNIKNKSLMFFASLLFAIKTIFIVLGFQLAPLSTAIIIAYTWPIFATILGIIILKEKIIRQNIYLLFISFIGIVLISFNQTISFGNLEFLGLSFMLLGAILHASVIVIFKKESDNNSKYTTIFYQNFIGFLIFLPFIFINKPLPTLFQTGIGISYGVVIGIVGFILFFSALKKINASTASHLTYVEVISAAIFGIVLFGELLTWNVLLGGILIIASTYFLKRE